MCVRYQERLRDCMVCGSIGTDVVRLKSGFVMRPKYPVLKSNVDDVHKGDFMSPDHAQAPDC